MFVRQVVDLFRPLLVATVLATCAAAGAAESGLTFGDRLDPAVIYRFDPLTDKLEPVAVGDLKPRNIYYRHSPSRGRHVWSQVDDRGALRFELGPGSSFPVQLFDLDADLETRRQVLEERAPDLARRLATQGARPSLRLGPDGRWKLDPAINEGRIYDAATGERFDWHMGRAVPVLSMGGNSWIYVDGRYRPTSQGYGGPDPVPDEFCSGQCLACPGTGRLVPGAAWANPSFTAP